MGRGKIGSEAPAFSLFPSPIARLLFLIVAILIGLTSRALFFSHIRRYRVKFRK